MARVVNHRAFGLLLAALCLAGFGPNTPPAAGQAPAGEPAPAQVQAIPPVEKDKDGYARGFNFPLAPPDGKWLTDAQGQRYFEHEVAKIPGTFSRMFNNTRVKFWATAPFELLRETDESFFVKIYAAEESGRVIVSKPTPEELETSAASFQAATQPADRLLFKPWNQGLPTRGQWRNGFAVADVDGDGRPDIVHGPPRKGGSAPVMFLSDGKGAWRQGRFPLPALPLDYGDAAVADFNGDGRLDLAFASHLRGIVVLVDDGQGGFKPWSEGIEFVNPGSGNTEPPFSSRAIEVADWNGDKRPDIVALGEGPSLATPRQAGGSTRFAEGSRGVRVYLNQGDGTWRTVSNDGVRSFGDALAVAELTGDRRPDILTASAAQGNRALLYAGQADGTWEQVAIELVRPAATFRGVAVADFDRDGRQDLAVGFASGELGVWRTGVDVLLARPELQWERRTVWAEASHDGVWALGAGDLDGDRAADLVGVTGEGVAWVFLGDGKGSFVREESPELAVPELATCKGYQVQLADFDRDGGAELVGGFAGEGSNLFGDEQCKTGGGLWVWKAVPRADGKQVAAKPE